VGYFEFGVGFFALNYFCSIAKVSSNCSKLLSLKYSTKFLFTRFCNYNLLFLGEPKKFTVEIQPSKNYPVDFYILMDLTATMADDLNNLKKLAQNICKFTILSHICTQCTDLYRSSRVTVT
jgi:hypothetical protein